MFGSHVLNITTDFEVIYLSLVNNIDYFFFIRDKYVYAFNFVTSLKELLSNIKWYDESLNEFYAEAKRFDFNGANGNGFRSFGIIFERCFSECYKFSKRLYSARNSVFFRAEYYLKEIQSLISVFDGLKPGLKYLKKMLDGNVSNDLLMPDKTFTAEELLIEFDGINQLGFYGRYEGFYYCTSMRRILQGVSVIMATFSDLYQNSGGPISRAALTILNGIKYILNPELRAQQIVDVAQNSSVEFLKAFWSLSETQFMKSLPGWVCPKMRVREEIFIPCEPIVLKDLNLTDITIPVPSSHIPAAPVRCLLLSSIHRLGQDLKNGKYLMKQEPKSSKLLFHCHGGGFISQNPESHEIYLRHWANDLNIPIISIDYSLAPEAPFPRALEEALLTYAWILCNPNKLGWTGETICFAGDSAGGTILMGLILKIISLNIRQPNGILCAYTPLVLDIVPSPSRLLCFVDPLLPLGFMISCLDAYVGNMQTDSDEYDIEPLPSLSGRASRKISSISEIFDSSINFLNKCEWTEVEANEPSTYIDIYDIDSPCFSEPNYVDSFISEYNCSAARPNSLCAVNKDFEVFDLPRDIFFDVKSKWTRIAQASFNRVSQAVMTSSIFQTLVSSFIPQKVVSNPTEKQSACISKSCILKKIKHLKIMSKNPLMSPLLASDDTLKKMPPLYLVSLNFDPCLDDSVTFAKRLQSLGCQVSLDILDGLPHGFLNFLPFSQEAHDGSNLCVRRLNEAMNLF